MQSQLEYQVFLQSELSRRKHRNPSYSLRAFARDLNISVSKLSLVMRGMKGLSAKSGQKIAKNIGLGDQETELFISLIEAKHSRSRVTRERALNALAQRFSLLPFETFQIICDWQYFAILELAETADFKSNAKWIARKLGLEEKFAKECIQKLFDLGLLVTDQNGKWIQTHIDLETPTEIPSRDIRNHHHQILNKAKEVLEEVAIDERDFSAMTLAFSSSEMEKAKKMIKEFRRYFSTEMAIPSQPKDRVYTLAIQLLPLDRK